MSVLDPEVLAERTVVVERHLRRVAALLPADRQALRPETEASDGVILHLWQTMQVILDLGVSACVSLRLGTPSGYGDAFSRMAAAGLLPAELAGRLSAAAGFRNLVAHAYESIDLARVYESALSGPADLRAFLRVLRGLAGRLPTA